MLHLRPAPRVLAAAAALALLLGGCGGGDEPAPQPATSTSAPAASDGGGADPSADAPSDAGGASPEPSAAAEQPYPVTPPAEPIELADDCTGEGMHRAMVGETASPALPERAAGSLAITLTGVDAEGRAQLAASLDGSDPRAIAPAAVGDSVEIDLWTISVTSICADSVEFDLVN
ncbi:hypothetical protein [Brachybacterium hainanense]|uniref:Uncharacterized protein n=1 Tax=Brachybacterium hainanense TaxID=1541174 RepID=A0ABV6R664_9MICO